MESVDLSASRCYTAQMPNSDSSDPRLRLDCRTGATTAIFQSRIITFGGITKALDLPPNFNTADIEAQVRQNFPPWDLAGNLNRFISREVFALRLTDHTWDHLAVRGGKGDREGTKAEVSDLENNVESASDLDLPQPRMFHAMMVYDNFVYIGGGVRFADTGGPRLEVLNDLWRFDLLDHKWKCLFPNDNDTVEPRYDHQFMFLSTLKTVGFPADYGLCAVGGLNQENHLYAAVSFCNLSRGTWHYDGGVSLLEVGRPNEEKPAAPANANPDASDNGDDSASTPLVEDFHAFNPNRGTPRGYRGSTNAALMQDVPGFPGRLICLDRSPSPRKYEPLVEFQLSGWGARPALAPADSEAASTAANSVSNPVGALSAVRTNVPAQLFFAGMDTFGENLIAAGFAPGERRLTGYVRNLRSHRWMRLRIRCLHKPYSHRLCRGFVWKSHHQMVFLGARRLDAASSTMAAASSLAASALASPATQYFDIYVYVPLAFTSTFGIESGASPDSAQSRSAAASKAAAVDKLSRATARNAAPAEKSFVAYANQIAPQLQISSISSVFPAAAVALAKNAFEWTVAFTDFEFVAADGTVVPVPMAVCRRRWGKKFDSLVCEAYAWSYTESQVPDALDVLHGTKKPDQTLTSPAFRHPFQQQQTTTSSSPLHPSLNPLTGKRYSSPRASIAGGSVTPLQSRRGSSLVHKTSGEMAFPHYSPGGGAAASAPLASSDIPQQPAMPNVDFRGRRLPPQTAAAAATQDSDDFAPPFAPPPATPAAKPSSLSSPFSRSIDSTPDSTQDLALESTDDSGTSTPAGPVPAPKISAEGIASYTLLENSVSFPEPSYSAIDVKRIPRALCLPYARQTVKAFAEYLYTGQVGSTWKVFPTATELLLLAKRYDLPLLYNLVLEMLFVVLARKEAQLVADVKALRKDFRQSTANSNSSSFGAAYSALSGTDSAIDKFSTALAKLDDGLIDRVLFRRASSVVRRASRRNSVATATPTILSAGSANWRDSAVLSREPLSRQTSIRKPNLGSMGSQPPSLAGQSTSSSPQHNGMGGGGDGSDSDTQDEAASTVRNPFGLLDDYVYDDSDGEVETAVAEVARRQNVVKTGDGAAKPESKKSSPRKGSKTKGTGSSTKEWPTFKQLVSPGSPPCSDSIVDLLVEVGALVNDMKLMLRAINAKEMAMQLRERKRLAVKSASDSLMKMKINEE